VQLSISRFKIRVVSLAKKATGDRSEPAVQCGEGGFADWVIVKIQGSPRVQVIVVPRTS
jgi:hypothetical protein